MANILLIETSTDVCSVAVAIGEGQIAAQRTLEACLHHTVYLTEMVSDCLAEAGIPISDLDAIAVSGGPGAYTSLRAGVSTAKGYCYALQKPLISINTLDALAWASKEIWSDAESFSGDIFYIPMIDARRNEVYAKIFSHNMKEILPETALILENNLFVNLLKNSQASEKPFCAVFSGNGSEKASTVLNFEKTVFSSTRSASAVYLAKLAIKKLQLSDFEDIANYEPRYAKPPNITLSKKIYF